MNSEFIATPLTRGHFSKPMQLQPGMSIRDVSPIVWEQSAIAQEFMSIAERKETSRTRLWLAVDESEVEVESLLESDDLYAPIKRALSALQIIHPVGARNTHLGFRKVSEGFEPVHSFHPQELKPTFLSKFLRLDEDSLKSDFSKVYCGVTRAERERIVRLQNPMVLLELGMQANHPYISTLLWTMGLDMLFMAGELKPFCERITNFLGGSTPAFPTLYLWKAKACRPVMTVSDIVKDLYSLRNVIAHGQRIPARYGASFGLKDKEGESFVGALQYSQILSEASLCLLSSSLHKIFTMDLVDQVADDSIWRKILKG